MLCWCDDHDGRFIVGIGRNDCLTSRRVRLSRKPSGTSKPRVGSNGCSVRSSTGQTPIYRPVARLRLRPLRLLVCRRCRACRRRLALRLRQSSGPKIPISRDASRQSRASPFSMRRGASSTGCKQHDAPNVNTASLSGACAAAVTLRSGRGPVPKSFGERVMGDGGSMICPAVVALARRIHDRPPHDRTLTPSHRKLKSARAAAILLAHRVACACEAAPQRRLDVVLCCQAHARPACGCCY